jgi:glycosyltransferase involved in cell wall biosynthesis
MENFKKSHRVLIYSPIFYPDIGGPAVQARFLTELLDENGFEVFVLKYSKNKYKNSKINIISLNWNPNPNMLTRIFRWLIGPLISLYFLIKIRPNLVLVNSVFWNGMLMGLWCRFFHIPTIIKFTGDWVFESTHLQKDKAVDLEKIYSRNIFSFLLFRVQRFFVSQFKIIWVISDFRKNNVLKLTHKPQIWVQNNFHDLPSFEIPITTRFKEPLIFVTTARLIPHKRIDAVIRVLSKLPSNYKFIVIGEGSELIRLQKLTIDLNLSNHIFFLGKISSNLLYEILAVSSVFISWSAEEGAPNSFVEALHFGLPIVSASVGGIPEMFTAGSKAAILLDPDNTDRLYDCLENLLKSPNLLNEMSLDAIKDAVKFSKSFNEKSFMDLIFSLVVKPTIKF